MPQPWLFGLVRELLEPSPDSPWAGWEEESEVDGEGSLSVCRLMQTCRALRAIVLHCTTPQLSLTLLGRVTWNGKHRPEHDFELQQRQLLLLLTYAQEARLHVQCAARYSDGVPPSSLADLEDLLRGVADKLGGSLHGLTSLHIQVRLGVLWVEAGRAGKAATLEAPVTAGMGWVRAWLPVPTSPCSHLPPIRDDSLLLHHPMC
jgi:hypothetical protein